MAEQEYLINYFGTFKELGEDSKLKFGYFVLPMIRVFYFPKDAEEWAQNNYGLFFDSAIDWIFQKHTVFRLQQIASSDYIRGHILSEKKQECSKQVEQVIFEHVCSCFPKEFEQLLHTFLVSKNITGKEEKIQFAIKLLSRPVRDSLHGELKHTLWITGLDLNTCVENSLSRFFTEYFMEAKPISRAASVD